MKELSDNLNVTRAGDLTPMITKWNVRHRMRDIQWSLINKSNSIIRVWNIGQLYSVSVLTVIFEIDHSNLADTPCALLMKRLPETTQFMEYNEFYGCFALTVVGCLISYFMIVKSLSPFCLFLACQEPVNTIPPLNLYCLRELGTLIWNQKRTTAHWMLKSKLIVWSITTWHDSAREGSSIWSI